MGRLLEKAISEASKLPESDQEAIGAWLLAEMESERRWGELFGRPGSALERMADKYLMMFVVKPAPLIVSSPCGRCPGIAE